MARKRLSMKRVREVLRLNEEGLSRRQIAAACGLTHPTVADYLRRAVAAGLAWPLPDGLGDEQLKNGCSGFLRQVAQRRQHPALHPLHSDFHLGLVARVADPGRHHREAVVVSQFLVARVDLRIVAVRPLHSGAQVVRHQHLRRAAEKLEHAPVRAEPVRQALRPARLPIGQVGRAQRADEHLRLANLAAARVDHLDGLPRMSVPG